MNEFVVRYCLLLSWHLPRKMKISAFMAEFVSRLTAALDGCTDLFPLGTACIVSEKKGQHITDSDGAIVTALVDQRFERLQCLVSLSILVQPHHTRPQNHS